MQMYVGICAFVHLLSLVRVPFFGFYSAKDQLMPDTDNEGSDQTDRSTI